MSARAHVAQATSYKIKVAMYLPLVSPYKQALVWVTRTAISFRVTLTIFSATNGNYARFQDVIPGRLLVTNKMFIPFLGYNGLFVGCNGNIVFGSHAQGCSWVRRIGMFVCYNQMRCFKVTNIRSVGGLEAQPTLQGYKHTQCSRVGSIASVTC